MSRKIAGEEQAKPKTGYSGQDAPETALFALENKGFTAQKKPS